VHAQHNRIHIRVPIEAHKLPQAASFETLGQTPTENHTTAYLLVLPLLRASSGRGLGVPAFVCWLIVPAHCAVLVRFLPCPAAAGVSDLLAVPAAASCAASSS
jgi:hypothetical protein